MLTPQYVKASIDGRIGRIRLIRPERYNALNRAMIREIVEAMERFDQDETVAVIVLNGEGKSFSAGADIEEMVDATPVSMELLDPFADWDRISRLHKPLIAAVHGFVLGGGFELALACDLIYATPETQFAFPEVGLGVMPGAGGTQRLTKRIGRTRALEWLWTGDRMPASEAQQLGIINRIVEADQLEAHVLTVADRIAAQPVMSVRLIKDAVDKAGNLSLQDGMDHERRNFYLLFGTNDQTEGMQAFVEKRQPTFKGN
ncbi:enoyl-CoA hydratase/isomerase family protein [Exiguobacterium sp. K1]|uniref:enoyl-CoA hydratase/isomerase family protein n=1 Tax=Exiguobacterium sp. K1 TaxID=2980105 RepID=UPI00299DA811|nr:enoyl-CoA hydratase-related protein [Exiguobacterium sp. K1]MDX1260948.1 enoyl-CoA hydratase-related protein [Exiguobacterium sp. K1]